MGPEQQGGANRLPTTLAAVRGPGWWGVGGRHKVMGSARHPPSASLCYEWSHAQVLGGASGLLLLLVVQVVVRWASEATSRAAHGSCLGYSARQELLRFALERIASDPPRLWAAACSPPKQTNVPKVGG